VLWSEAGAFHEEPFDVESELEEAILEVSGALFGKNRVYFETKKKIGKKGETQNIPDSYLIDLSSTKEPKLYIVENELAKHDPLKHVAVQILEFSLSFETSQHRVKNIVKQALTEAPNSFNACTDYAAACGFENVDVLLERMIYGEYRFNALVIIDDLSDELEKVLISRFQFPVEILTLERYRDEHGKRLYRLEPFLSDVTTPVTEGKPGLPPIDPSELDTIVVPAREEGFQETFLSENRWYAIRIHSSMLAKIKFIAAYRVAPESAITHLAPVASIEQWKDTSKYVVNFTQAAIPLDPIRLVHKGQVRAPQGPRYTSKAHLDEAKNLDDVF
jgi:regulator of RNase E activity RraB